MASNTATKTDDAKPFISSPTQAEAIPPIPRNFGISHLMSLPMRLLPESSLPRPVLRDGNPSQSQIPIPIRTYKCKQCPAEFRSHHALGGHASSHTKRRKFQQRVIERIMVARREWEERQVAMCLPHNPPPFRSNLFLDVPYMARVSPSPQAPPPPPPPLLSSQPVHIVSNMERIREVAGENLYLDNAYDNDYYEIQSDDGESVGSSTRD